MFKWFKRLGFVIAFGFLVQSTDMVDLLMGQFRGVSQPMADAVSRIASMQTAQAGQPVGEWISGKVISVSDGDTVTVDTGAEKVRIRLLAIDSPEVSCHGQISNCKETGQAFGREAKEALTKAILKKDIKVRLNGESTYDRKVGTLFYNNIDVNYLMVQEGFAWHYAKFARQQPGEDAEKYAQAQERARAARKGLWRDASPEAPWEWRKGRPRS